MSPDNNPWLARAGGFSADISTMKHRHTDAIVRIAYSDRLNAKVFAHSIERYLIKGDKETYQYDLNRYMVHVPDAFYSPAYRFVLDRATKSVVVPDMVLKQTLLSMEGFGTTTGHAGDGRHFIAFDDNETTVKGPVICVSPWRVFSNQILHVLMGIVHCDDILGAELPILVPDDLGEREKRNLALIGVGADRLISVPRHSATRVIDAFVPSKSFGRSSWLGPDGGATDQGFFLEPNDVRAYNKRVQAGLSSGGARVVFIGRKDAGARFLANEAEVLEALSVFDPRYIIPSETPIGETAAAIANADIVISPFGSAILNFLAARPGTALFEIDHPANDWLGRAICRVLDCRHHICSRAAKYDTSYADISNTTADIGELVELVTNDLAARDI